MRSVTLESLRHIHININTYTIYIIHIILYHYISLDFIAPLVGVLQLLTSSINLLSGLETSLLTLSSFSFRLSSVAHLNLVHQRASYTIGKRSKEARGLHANQQDTNLVSWPISAFASLRNSYLERRLREKFPRLYSTHGNTSKIIIPSYYTSQITHQFTSHYHRILTCSG